MRHHAERLLRGAGWAAAGAWLLFTAWLFVYGMPLSGAFALAGLLSFRAPRFRLLSVAAAWLLGLLAVPVVGLPEYAATTNRLHCRTLGFLGRHPSADCSAADVAAGEAVARDGGPLFSARERLGVHGFNHLLALGGVLVGLPEVAWETARLSWSPDPLGDATRAATDARRAQCTAVDGTQGTLAPLVVADDDLPMRSARVRARVAAGMARLAPSAGATRPLGEVHFVAAGTTDASGYGGALVNDSVRVALALEVPDSRLSLTRLPGRGVAARWEGTIGYPGADLGFAATLPTAFGPRVLRVSEAVFCGMHVDGAMNPYPLRYEWMFDPDDPRIGPDVGSSDRGLFEAVASGVARLVW